MSEPIIIYKEMMNFGKDKNGNTQMAIAIPINLRKFFKKKTLYKITIENYE